MLFVVSEITGQYGGCGSGTSEDRRRPADPAPGYEVVLEREAAEVIELVRGALGLDLERRRSWSKQAERNFAVAVARVATHEVIHALGALGHSAGGLMAARLDRNALTARALRVDLGTVAALRQAFDRGALTADGSWTPSLLRGNPVRAAAELMAVPGPNR